ncbi:hypothetical protein KAZ93_00260 [Patescibacteria group bacterium]|nr:hypothetical protein [Patescibacteria group bacterium]
MSPGTTTKLVVDTTRFMFLGTDDGKSVVEVLIESRSIALLCMFDSDPRIPFAC